MVKLFVLVIVGVSIVVIGVLVCCVVLLVLVLLGISGVWIGILIVFDFLRFWFSVVVVLFLVVVFWMLY